MGYKSLLFCPDENSAQAVTQILTELEFGVEAANEPFGAVKKLGQEQFDALVVDCQSEQDAALLFKTARESAQNHSSLSVAVVEGQAGVAKAFRIGANLVLTKPINVEQAKSTLRVARGLLRKNEVKATAQPTPTSSAPLNATNVQASMTLVETRSAAVSFPSGSVASAVAFEPAKPPSTTPVTPQPEVPFSGLEVEADPTPAPEAAEIAVLESLPDLGGKPLVASANFAPIEAQPVAASASGQAAAVAPAFEKTPVLGLNRASAPPMVTNDPIVAEKRYEDPLVPPTLEFQSLESQSATSGGATKFFKIAFILAAAVVAAYFGWQKLQPTQYLQKIRPAQGDAATAPLPASTPAAMMNTPPSNAGSEPSLIVSAPAPLTAAPANSEKTASPLDDNVSTIADSSGKNNKMETIEVKEMPMPGDAKPPSPKVEPLVVKPDRTSLETRKPALAAPPVQVSNLNGSGTSLPNLTSVDAALPKLAPGTVRVSQGVSQGLILKKVPPVYPTMALQLHKEGTVELLATISRQGAITHVQVLSGDSMFSNAAVAALRQWKYRPYLLNGEPVEIQTQVTMVFKSPH